MKLVIDIDESLYKNVIERSNDGYIGSDVWIAVVNGKPYEERQQGEWIYTDKEDKKKGYGGYCSVCKCDMPIGMNDWKQEYYESKFCPNCGAKMEVKTNENND